MQKLDQRIGEYLDEMLHECDVLMNDAISARDKQLPIIRTLKHSITVFHQFYDESLPSFENLEMGTRIYQYDLHVALGTLTVYCRLLETNIGVDLSDTQRQSLSQIKNAHHLIMQAFTRWIKQEHQDDSYQT